jgi:hypothetical protein
MLSEYTIKYISLLQEEVQLTEWFENNKPTEFDIERIILEQLEIDLGGEQYRGLPFASASVINYMVDHASHIDYSSDVSQSMDDVSQSMVKRKFGSIKLVIDWIKSVDEEKACLYIAKLINKFTLDNPKGRFNSAVRKGNWLEDTSSETDFESMPLKEQFLKTSSVGDLEIEHNSLSSFMSFDSNKSIYAKHNSDFKNDITKEDYLRWYLAPNDISIQVTPNSYTQVGNKDLVDDGDGTSNVNLKNDVVYFHDGEIKKSSVDSSAFVNETNELEDYALDIQAQSKYSVMNIEINVLLERLHTAAMLTSSFTSDSVSLDKSISYKIIFDIKEGKSVLVPSVDMYQSVLYLKAMGTELISLYYDAEERRIVLRGKDYNKKEKREVFIDGGGGRRGSANTKIIETEVTIPTFAIIYEQSIQDVTSFVAIEYIQFFDKELTFRDKYDMLNVKRNAPLELPTDFDVEYPAVAASYSQQVEVALSEKLNSDKIDYINALIAKYLASYTQILEDEDGNFKRESIPVEEWTSANYVMKVHEAYWNYNSDIETNELLAFFMSKGNDVGYRLLCMKILGVDYNLFESAITDYLIDTKNLFIAKMDIDEENIEADIDYQSLNSFISGNIYRKEEIIIGKDDSSKTNYRQNLSTYFGEGVGEEIYGKTVLAIEDAVASRFIPTLSPQARTEKEAAQLQLNIDIMNPVFFRGEVDAYEGGQKSSKTPTLLNTVLSTGSTTFPAGSADRKLNIVWKQNNSNSRELGHFSLFSDWISQLPADEILGDSITAQEIKDAYIYPISQTNFIYNHIYKFFKDENGNITFFDTKETGNSIVSSIKSATDAIKTSLVLLGKIANPDIITTAEANAMKIDFIMQFKQRYWAARREGRRLFNRFLAKEISQESREEIDTLWNNMFNNYAKPDLKKVPMFPTLSYYFGSKNQKTPFSLRQAQLEGIRHVLSRENSGLLLHEVGFGKTTSSIAAISSMLNTGDAKRVLFLVPNSVYDKFQQEIKGTDDVFGVLPNVNIVLLDNLKEDAVKELKNFSELEKRGLVGFKSFKKEFSKIYATLGRDWITLPNDPMYRQDSSWGFFFDEVVSEVKIHVEDYEDLSIIKNNIATLNDIFKEVDAEFQEVFASQNNIVTSAISTEEEVRAAKKEIQSSAESYANSLKSKVDEYISFLSLSLIDEMGHYKPEYMQDNTILIAKHTAAYESIKPNPNAVLRALMFKEGLGEPTKEVTGSDYEEWKAITGLTKNKINPAIKILKKHPISLDKLMVDGVVIDEIHNFNNIVTKAGAKGFYFRGKTWVTNPKLQRNQNGQTDIMHLQDVKTTNNSYSMRYDAKGRGADSRGSKLTGTAICMDIQYKAKGKKNTILLSATPFTDTPFQVLSVLGMANYEMLAENGINSGWEFFNNYVDETYKNDLRHDGGYGLFIDVNGYYNDKALSNLITNVTNVKITDVEIEKSRPKKAIIPQNTIAEDTENKVSETTQMGDMFSELSEVNSRVMLSDAQEKYAEIIRDYIKDDNNQTPIKELFPINENRITGKLSTDVDEEVAEIVKAEIEKAKKDPENADDNVSLLEDIYKKGRYAQHKLIKKGIDKIKKSILGEEVETEEDEFADASLDTSQMSNIQKLAGKAIGCQQAQQSLVISPYLVNLGDSSYTSPLLEPLEPNPAKVFVESSPKLMYVMGAIQQAIDYQSDCLEFQKGKMSGVDFKKKYSTATKQITDEQLKDIKNGKLSQIGGQVIYFDRHNFNYGGKKYNAFELVAEYVANNISGISSDKHESGEWSEIAIIEGGLKDDDVTKGKSKVVTKRGKTSIKDSFNSGEIKVLIGSKAIKEGIDLQGNAHSMYICEAEFSPEVAMQLEGRIWRQKNPYDVVRIIYVLMMNTIDSFIYSKINRKVNMIKRMLELGVYEMNTTQFVIDIKEQLIQLETDPDKLTAIEYEDRIDDIKNEAGTLSKRIDRIRLMEREYNSVSTKMNRMLAYINPLYNGISDIRIAELKNKIKSRLAKIQSQLILQDLEAAKFKKDIEDWLKLPANKGKYEVTDADVEKEYLKEITEKPKLLVLPPLDEPIDLSDLMTKIEIEARKVYRNIEGAQGIESQFRKMHRYEQEELRNKKRKTPNEKIWFLYYDLMIKGTEYEDGIDPLDFKSLDIINFSSRIRKIFKDDTQGMGVIETYQQYVKDGKTIYDVPEIIEAQEEKLTNYKNILDDIPAFKAKIRAEWVIALAERVETTDMTIDGLVGTLKASLPLLKIRKHND